MAPPINPQILAALMQQGGQQQGGVPNQQAAPQGPLPPTNPVQPQLDPQQIGAQAMQQGMQQTTQQLNRANTLSDRAMQLSQSPYSTPDPKYGFRPNFEQGQGVGGFFHNLGQALLTLGAATRPGQAVQGVVYGPGIRARQAEIASRAAEIGTIEKGAEQAEQATGPLAKMGPAYMGAEARGVSAQAAASRAQTASTNAVNRHNEALGRLQLESKNLDLKTKQEKFNEEYKNAYLDAYTARTEAGERENDARVGALTDVRSVAEQNKYDQSIIGNAERWLGVLPGVAVPKESTAPAQAAKPQGSPQGGPKKASGSKGGGQQFHYDKNGNRVAGQ